MASAGPERGHFQYKYAVYIGWVCCLMGFLTAVAIFAPRYEPEVVVGAV